ncbi:MAG TPA: hypothetical protein VMK65_13285 [Longimicrobiales bacterium]|nr:hypothetical protein [Longimicrobiales bacterium]
MGRNGAGRSYRDRAARWVRRAWGGLAKWQKALGVVLAVLILGALADGLDSGRSVAESTDPTQLAVAGFCRAEVAAEMAVPPERVEHSPDDETHVKEFGAGQYRVTLWARTPEEPIPSRFLCLALETEPGSGTFLLADLMRR